jgi:hypothetical protein
MAWIGLHEQSPEGMLLMGEKHWRRKILNCRRDVFDLNDFVFVVNSIFLAFIAANMSRKKGSKADKTKGILLESNPAEQTRKSMKEGMISESVEDTESLLQFLTKHTEKVNNYLASKLNADGESLDGTRKVYNHEDHVKSVRKWMRMLQNHRSITEDVIALEVSYYLHEEIALFCGG